MSAGIRFTGGVTTTDVTCPMCGALNRVPYDLTYPSKRQLVTCAAQVGLDDKGGCGEEFAYHVTVAVTGHTAALGEWKAGPTVFKGEAVDPEDADDERARQALRDRLRVLPPRDAGVADKVSEGGERLDERSDDQPLAARATKGKPPLIARQGRPL